MPHKLLNTFEQYVGLSRSTSAGLDSSKFRKICKDSRLFDQNFKEADADLIFTKIKNTSRKLDFDGFKTAVAMCAEKKGVDPRFLADRIYETTANGPTLTGTVADANRFHDDPRTYTGVHKAGGPTIIDSDKQGLNRLLDRSSADVRGVKKDMREAHGRPNHKAAAGRDPYTQQLSGEFSDMRIGQDQHGGSHRLPMPPPPARATDPYHNPYPSAPGARVAAPPPQGYGYPPDPHQAARQYHDSYTHHGHQGGVPPTGRAFAEPPPPPIQPQSVYEQPPAPIEDPETELYNVYLKYCTNPETAEMDSSKFVKFCKDSGIIDDRTFKMSDADLLFQRSKKAGNYGKKITYEEFRTVAFPAVALKKDVSQADLAEIVIRLGQRGPSIAGTIPQKNRFHDDRSTYTGVHVAGGPSTKNDTGAISMESLLDRSDADIRGIKMPQEGHQEQSYYPGEGRDISTSQYYSDMGYGGGGGQNYQEYTDPALYPLGASGGSDPYSYSPQTEMNPGYDQQAMYNPQQGHGRDGGYYPEEVQEYRAPRPDVPQRAPPNQSTFHNGAPPPTFAGQANKKGGIYDRLSSTNTFTGVYAERFKSGDGRINGDTINRKSNFKGNTNSGTNEQIHDLSQIINRR